MVARSEASTVASASFDPHTSKPTPGKRSTWGTSDRFEAGTGWTREQTRADQRFAALNAASDASYDGEDALISARTAKAAARPDGRSRFVVSRPESSLSVPRAPPGTLAADMCTAEGFGLMQAILKVPGRFYIQPRDADGNPVAASFADVFRIHIVGLETPTHSVVEEDDGRLAVRWVPSVSGDFKLIVTINGVHIASSPFQAGASQGSIVAQQSVVVDVPERVGVGQRASFTIEARDQMGNLASYPPLGTCKYSFSVEVDGPHAPGLTGAADEEVEEARKLLNAAAPPAEPSEPVQLQLGKLSQGLQSATIQLATVGVYYLSVLGEDGTLVCGKRYPIEVESTALLSRYCLVHGGGLTSALAGKAADFVIRALDKHGNACEVPEPHASEPNSGFSVRLTFVKSTPAPSGATDDALAQFKRLNKFVEGAETEGSVAKLATGLFKSKYQLTRAGEYELSVSYAGAPVPNSPWALHVRAGVTHARSCVRLHQPDEAAALPPAAAGRKASFLLLARDYFGNVRHEGGDNICAGLRGPERCDCEVVDRGNGLYQIFYEPTSHGEYMLAVTLRTEPVLGSPFTLRCLPAGTHGPACVASGAALNLGDCGERHSFMVEARDSHGNPRGFGGDHVVAYIVGPGDSSKQHDCHARDCEDGWYEMSYKVDTIGRYRLHITVNGVPLSQSPQALTITGGRTHPPACVRKNAIPGERRLPIGTAGSPYSFIVEARDDFDEPRGFGGDPFVCTVSGGPAHAKTVATVEDHSDGTYEMHFTPEFTGAYLVAVTLKGEHIAGSRFALEVKPSSAHAPSCVASGGGLRQALAGQRARFAVQTWDAHGNVCDPPLSSFRVRLVCDDSPIVVVPKGIDVGGGRYTFTYSTEVAGTYTAHVLVATKAEQRGGAFSGGKSIRFEPTNIAGSPFRVVVKPGPTYSPACGVRWVSPPALTVGERVELAIQSRDRYFNARDEPGDKFTIALKAIVPAPKTAAERHDMHSLEARDGRRQVDVPRPPLTVRGEVHDEADVPGAYLASVAASIAGEYRVILGLEGQAEGEEAEGEGEEEAPDLTDEEKRLAEAATQGDLAAEAQAEAEAEAIRRASNGAPPAPQLSFGALATLMSRIRAWKQRGAAAAIQSRRQSKRIFTAVVQYTPDTTHHATCVVSGDGLWRARAMQRALWTIQPRDRFSNATALAAHAFGVVVRAADDGYDPSVSYSDDEARRGGAEAGEFASVSMSNAKYGATTVSWLWNTSGDFDVHVMLRGQPLVGSPFRCVVAPTYSGEPLATMTQRQTTLDVFHSGAAIGWQEESATIWESHRGDKHEYVQRGLTHPAALDLALGSDVARTWALQQLDPASFDAAQAAEVLDGVSGKRGRYVHRKRGAMLHFRLAAMSNELASGGVSMPRPDEALTPRAALTESSAGGGGALVSAPSARVGGGDSSRSVHSSVVGESPAPTPRLDLSGVSGNVDKADGGGAAAAKWGKLRGNKVARRLARDRQIAPPQSWRMLGPEPEPPTQPLPPSLTPRAQALALRLEQMGM